MKTRLFIMVCLLFSLTSCNKWLDVELENKVDEDKLFSTAEGFQEALAGVYSQMAGKSMYGQALTMEYVDLMGQYYSYNSVGTAYTYFKDFNYTNSGVKSTIASFWKNLYNCIASANNILNWADKNKGVLGESNRNQVRGEALALRAFLHFDLYRLFCPDVKLSPRAEGIPYNKEFGVSLPPMYTVEEIVQLVINDLKEAETLLANDPIVSIVPYTLSSKSDADKYVARMNLYGVKAMLARVYQAKGDNVKAVAYAKEVIESGKFRLLEFASVDQTEALTDVLFSDEHIFSLRNKELKDYSEKLHRDESKNGVTSFKPLPFGGYYNWYEGNNDDVRYSKWFNLGDFMKYYMDNADAFFRKMPMIKLSEMYLIVAECSFDMDSEVSLEYLNVLRDHRIRNHVHLQYLSKESIQDEMRREYLGEGQMWYVMKRNNLKIETGASSGDIEPSDVVYVFPMPDAELEDGHR